MGRLYPCVYCTQDGHCNKYSDNETTSWCVLGPCEDEEPSNADRIRAMTDEELAELFAYRDVCPPGRCQHMYDGVSCADCWTKWLNQPAQDKKA